MNFEEYVIIGAIVIVVLGILSIIIWKLPKRLKREYYVTRWRNLQKRLPAKEQWPQAIIEADDLLNEALKSKRFKGKNMGERLVEAQKNFTSNDEVWFGHKLRTRIDHNPEIELRKSDVQKALYGLRQGLKDIGAF